MSREYKIRETPPGRWCLTVPREIKEAFGPEDTFSPYVTKEGIHFRLASLGPFAEDRVDRIERAVGTMAWWLVQAQTGFAERDARGIEKILDGSDGAPVAHPEPTGGESA